MDELQRRIARQGLALVGDFVGLVGWFPVATKSVVDTSGVRAVRHRTLPGGSQLSEGQESRDDTVRYYEYVVIAGALPCTDYLSRLAVSAAGSGARSTWSAQFVQLPVMLSADGGSSRCKLRRRRILASPSGAQSLPGDPCLTDEGREP